MSDGDGEARSGDDAVLIAAGVLSGLADVLRRDDPQMPDPAQREKKAALLQSVAGELLAEQGLQSDLLRHSSETAANLEYLLGISRRSQAAGDGD